MQSRYLEVPRRVFQKPVQSGIHWKDIVAKQSGKSLNQWVEEAIVSHLHERHA